jgi:hypothetical protein
MKTTTKLTFLAALALAATLAACGGGSDTLPGDAVPDLPDAAGDPGPDGTGDVTDDDRGDLATDESLGPDWHYPPDVAEAGDVEPCDAAEQVAKGIDWLAKAESGFARNEFEAAVVACPDDVRARFGAALAEMTFGAEQFVSALTVLSGQGTGPTAPSKPFGYWPLDAPPGSQNEWLAGELHKLMVALRSSFAAAADNLVAIGDADPQFEMDASPVYLGIKPSLILRGRFDTGDVFFMRAVANLMTGILDVFVGQDLDSDVMSMVSMAKDGIDGDVDFMWISRFAAYLLGDSAHFLDLHPEDGLDAFQDAKTRFADVSPLLEKAIAKMREAGAGDDQVSFIEDLGTDVTIKVRNRVRKDDQGKPAEEPWSITLTKQHLQAFADCSKSILTPGYKVTLHGGVVPVLSAIVVGMVRTGILDSVDLVKLPIDISPLDVEDLAGVIRSLIPNVMAFDWGEFFEHPVGLRAWFPAYTTDKPLWQNDLLAEWECPGDLGTDGYPNGKLRLLCTKDAVLTDAAHYVGTSYATTADGILSGFPVLAFPDPTLNHLAYVKLDAAAGSADTTGYVLADQTSLNAALAKLLGGILGLLGG